MAGSDSSKSAAGLLKVIFLAHLVLSAWGMQSPYLVPTGYLYYNLIFMISLIWAVASDNADSVSMAFLINVACIIMDAFTLSFWPRGGPSREKVYFGIAIANAVLRGVTAMLLYRFFQEKDTEGTGIRGVFGDVSGAFRSATGAREGGRKGYESLDQQEGPSSSGNGSQGASQTEQQRGGGSGRGTAPAIGSFYFRDEISAFPRESEA